MNQPKEWVRISRSPNITTATVTLQDGSLSVRWSVKTYASCLKAGLAEARAGAEAALAEIREALQEEGR